MHDDRASSAQLPERVFDIAQHLLLFMHAVDEDAIVLDIGGQARKELVRRQLERRVVRRRVDAGLQGAAHGTNGLPPFDSDLEVALVRVSLDQQVDDVEAKQLPLRAAAGEGGGCLKDGGFGTETPGH